MENDKQLPAEKPEDEGHEYPGAARLKDVPRIVSNPLEFGFEWSGWDASSKTDKDGKLFPGGLTVLRKDFKVLPKVVSAGKFGKFFGESKLVDAYNGTSGRVTSQEIGRSLLLDSWNDHHAAKVTEAVARVEVVKRHLLGLRAKGGGGGQRKVWIVNGVSFFTEADAIAESKRQGQKFVAMDGSVHTTALAAKQQTVSFLMEIHKMTHEQAVALVSNMPE